MRQVEAIAKTAPTVFDAALCERLRRWSETGRYNEGFAGSLTAAPYRYATLLTGLPIRGSRYAILTEGADRVSYETYPTVAAARKAFGLLIRTGYQPVYWPKGGRFGF